MLRKSGDVAIEKAVDSIYVMSEDDKIREAARMREKRLHDEASALSFAKEKGRLEGRTEGEKIGLSKGRTEIIEKLRKSGFTEKQISDILDK